MRLLRWLSRTQISTHSRVLVVNGHPDPRPERFCAGLCAAFAQGARTFGRQIRDFTMSDAKDSAGFGEVIDSICWSDRMFVAYPLWLGKPPPLLRQLFDAYACLSDNSARVGHPRAVRVVVTASLPALLYRTGNAEEESSVVPSLAGLEMARTTIIGSVETISKDSRERWLANAWRLGTQDI